MGKEIDALKELFEGMRSAVFTAPSAGPVKLVASSPQGEFEAPVVLEAPA